MAFDVKPLLRIAPAIQAASLVGSIARKKKRRAGDMFGDASNIIIGSALIQAESAFIEGM